MIRKGDWKLIHHLHDNSRHLYNLADDLGETTDLLEKYPETSEELYLLLDHWRNMVKAELPVPNPDFDPE